MPARKIEAVQRASEALRLRGEGLSYRAIGERLNISPQTAWNDVQAALEIILVENATILLRLELERLDSLQFAVWPQATSGDCRAIDRVLRIMERRAKLLGLDSPVKVAPTDPTGTNPYEAMSAEELRALAKEIAGFDAT